jgi:hypothetical protein
MNSMMNWATAKTNPLLGKAPGGLEKMAINMAKSAACKADVSTVKKAISMMPDAMLARMIKSSPMCQTGGKRKTRKQTRKPKRKSKTRKH